ncbi:MAG: bifunctional glutamate N-acetyltransferase/amino-acid acetyltransferase ArgJ [Chloroflexi bacterium]|nr:bifunctional glutamate N-acetyltransferase/amino-acid acetyltransferase ArgJ [Chloroflexota bacterium]MBI3931412.1 bifunctional glutamate N-acetyltransferase/amino-acid acetyltransferase ArgJ [Chloroflexota bacterium]
MKTTKIDFISGGTVTSAQGFYAGATYAGLKKKTEQSLDMGILFSEAPCVAAALLTTNKIKSAPVVLCQERLQQGRAVAIVVNSGCANAYTGEQGLADAAEMATLAANGIGVAPEDVLVASTGVTGQPLPMALIRAGISQIILSQDGGHELARAIMTTDTVPKETAVAAAVGGNEFTIGGIAKGSGMIHPDLATMFCFLATDAAVELDFLKTALRRAVDASFNMISVDGDTSPSDMVLVMANGLAGNEAIAADSQPADTFQQALDQICIHLARAIARDGEGATRLIEVTVAGAISVTDARLAARTIVSSPLVKTAVHGADPNWGRIMAALGRSGAEVMESKIDLYLGDISVVKGGRPLPFSEPNVIRVLKKSEVPIRLDLNLGTASATAWGCDLSEEYVAINSQYMT